GAWMELTPFGWVDGYRAIALMRERIPAHTLIPCTDWALAEAIERLAARRIEDRSVVARPLRALPDELTAEEGIADMAVGVRGGKKAGLVVVTGQRVLWLSSADDEHIALQHSSLAAADARGADLDLRWDGGAERLQIIPAGAAPTLAHAI